MPFMYKTDALVFRVVASQAMSMMRATELRVLGELTAHPDAFTREGREVILITTHFYISLLSDVLTVCSDCERLTDDELESLQEMYASRRAFVAYTVQAHPDVFSGQITEMWCDYMTLINEKLEALLFKPARRYREDYVPHVATIISELQQHVLYVVHEHGYWSAATSDVQIDKKPFLSLDDLTFRCYDVLGVDLLSRRAFTYRAMYGESQTDWVIKDYSTNTQSLSGFIERLSDIGITVAEVR